MKSPGNKEKSRLFTDESVDFVVIVLFWLPARFAAIMAKAEIECKRTQSF
jgi:hypothetical protein